jgi:hypothetical protein
MRTKTVLAVLLFVVAVPNSLLSSVIPVPEEFRSRRLDIISSSTGTSHVDPGAHTVRSARPTSQTDLLQEYEAQMEAVFSRFNGELDALSQAVEKGNMTREQADRTSWRKYQVARMQFQLFSALHTTLQQETTEKTAQERLISRGQNETVVVALPFSSLQVNPPLSQYLRLTRSQIVAIQKLMSEERPNVEPLTAHLSVIGERLAVSRRREFANEEEVRTLSTAQTALLNKLMAANSRMQAKLRNLLTPEQRRRLDLLKRANHLSAGGEE